MAQLSDDCFAFGGPLLSIDAARALMAERVAPVAPVERVPLPAAIDRVLAEDVVAGIDVPNHDNSAVDGYAVRFADLNADTDTVLPIAGRVAAGQAAPRPEEKVAVRIFTGAPMPPGFDTVMMQEDCTAAEGTVTLRPGLKQGANRRKAGEDIRKGAVVLTAGLRLRPQDLGLAASVGAVRLAVRSPLRVAVLSTGDELVDPAAQAGRPLPPAAIYDSNRYTLAALLRRMGCDVTDLGILPDRLPAIRAALETAAPRHDLILTSGGMSTGEEDHMKAAVEALGTLHFWRLAIKPGRPVAMGQVGGVPVVGLPGNPVAVMITFLHLARPLIQRLQGWHEPPPPLFPVTAAFTYRKKTDRREYVRVTLKADAAGGWEAHKFPRDGAGILSSMAAADGLVELREDVTAVAPGDTVPYLPLSCLI